MKNVTREDIYASGITGAYDASMKKLLSNKEILVPILQMTIPEYEGYTQEEILSCLDIDSITGEDFVSDIPADLRLHKEESELSSITEKLIRFDIRFKARNPKLSTEKMKVHLHMDLEAQRSYRPKNPSYPVIKGRYIMWQETCPHSLAVSRVQRIIPGWRNVIPYGYVQKMYRKHCRIP